MDTATYTLSDLETLDFVRAHLPSVKEVDSDRDLSLMCYSTCKDDEKELVRHCRGLVYDQNKLLVKTFPHTPEYVVEDALVDLFTQHPLDTCMVFDSHEGTLLRVFFAQDQWYIATHKKLDAYKSRWSSEESFGHMFEMAVGHTLQSNPSFTPDSPLLDQWLATLVPTLCYTFLVRNTADNRIVCNAPDRPTVYFTGTFPLGAITEIPEYTVQCGIPMPERKKFRGGESELFEYIHKIDYSEVQGVVIVSPVGVFKIVHPVYKRLYNIRGNEHNLVYRYLQLRMDREQRETLLQLYPDLQRQVDATENSLYTLAKRIKHLYIERYANKDLTPIPSAEFRLVKMCHGWHCQDRKVNKISVEYVIDLLNTQTPAVLHRLLRDTAVPEAVREAVSMRSREDDVAVVVQ